MERSYSRKVLSTCTTLMLKQDSQVIGYQDLALQQLLLLSELLSVRLPLCQTVTYACFGLPLGHVMDVLRV